ncbi:hypothetical protein Hanom_Chr03g00205971 [Helianthus anomalus]
MWCGAGLWRGLGINVQVTTLGGLGFRRGPLGGGFSLGIGWGYQDDMTGSHWPRQVAIGSRPKPPPHHTVFNVGQPREAHPNHVSGHTPNPYPTISSGFVGLL